MKFAALRTPQSSAFVDLDGDLTAGNYMYKLFIIN